jgi:hypothetical protein
MPVQSKHMNPNMEDRLAVSRHCRTITPSDTDELEYVTKAIMVTATGNLNVIFDGDTVAVVIAVTQNILYSGLAIKQILSTSTTATGIKAFY